MNQAQRAQLCMAWRPWAWQGCACLVPRSCGWEPPMWPVMGQPQPGEPSPRGGPCSVCDHQGSGAARKSPQDCKQGQPKACAYERTLAQWAVGPQPVSGTISGSTSATGSKEHEPLGLALGEALGGSVDCPAVSGRGLLGTGRPWPPTAFEPLGPPTTSAAFPCKMSLVTGATLLRPRSKGRVQW